MAARGHLLLLFGVLWLMLLFVDAADSSENSAVDETTNASETASDAQPKIPSENTSGNASETAPESENVMTGGPKNATAGRDSTLSSLYINTVKPGLGSPMTEKVFKEGSLFGLFDSCGTAEGDDSVLEEGSVCFSDDEYNDRLTFEITYGLPASDVQSAFHDHPPVLQLLGNSSESADSEITESQVLAATSTAKVTVSYLCRTGANSIINLKLKLQFGDGDEDLVPIVWTKMCSSGANAQLEFGYTVDDDSSGETKRHPFGSDADAPYVVPPGDVSTEVYAKLQQAGAQQKFLAPLVSSQDSDVVKVTVRGNHPNGGILKGLEMSRFQITYECLKKGSSDIFVSVGIPPFQNLTSSWEKDCGGKTAAKLSVGSTEGSFDVVDMGKPTPKYMVGIENIGTEHSEEHLHLPGNQSDWTIFMTYGKRDPDGVVSKDSALHIGRIGVTVEHPDIIAVSTPQVSVPGTIGWRSVSNRENALRHGDKLRISFHFACRKVGESRLLFTVPLLDYDTLEFGIAKECDHAGTAHKSKQFVLTVGNVFWGFIFVAVAFIIYFVRRRRKGNVGFVAVPVTDK